MGNCPKCGRFMNYLGWYAGWQNLRWCHRCHAGVGEIVVSTNTTAVC